jgi:hypothetical protein
MGIEMAPTEDINQDNTFRQDLDGKFWVRTLMNASVGTIGDSPLEHELKKTLVPMEGILNVPMEGMLNVLMEGMLNILMEAILNSMS